MHDHAFAYMFGTFYALAAAGDDKLRADSTDNFELFAENNMLRCRLATVNKSNSELKVHLNNKAAENAVLAKKLQAEESESCKQFVEYLKLSRDRDALKAENAKLAADLTECYAKMYIML